MPMVLHHCDRAVVLCSFVPMLVSHLPLTWSAQLLRYFAQQSALFELHVQQIGWKFMKSKKDELEEESVHMLFWSWKASVCPLSHFVHRHLFVTFWYILFTRKWLKIFAIAERCVFISYIAIVCQIVVHGQLKSLWL